MKLNQRWYLGALILTMISRTCLGVIPSGMLQVRVSDSTNHIWDITGIDRLQNPQIAIFAGGTSASFPAPLLQASNGKIGGTGSTQMDLISPFFTGVIDASYKTSGSLTGSKGISKLRFISTASGIQVIQGKPTTFSSSFGVKATFNSPAQSVSGLYTAVTKASGQTGLKSAGTFDFGWVDVVASMGDGGWALRLQLTNDAVKRIGGSADVLLSSGKSLSFTIKGTYKSKSDASVLVLSPTAANKGSSLKISMTGSTMTSIKGRLLGQAVNAVGLNVVANSPASERRIGRLEYTVRWILPPAVYSAITASNRAALSGLGMSFDDQGRALNMPTNPLPGYWIVLGDQRVMTDTNGAFAIDVPFGTTTGYVVPEPSKTGAGAVAFFLVSQLAMPGQTSSPILVQYQREGLPNMDLPDDSVAAKASSLFAASGPLCGYPCPPGANNGPCCRDYDGILVNDGCKHKTLDERIERYFGSTCHLLVLEGLCANEYNALSFIPTRDAHLLYRYYVGPACYDNHKYRNCQNVDLNLQTAFTLSATSTRVRAGTSTTINVYNNSRANETMLVLFGGFDNVGTLSGSLLSQSSLPLAYTLRHYDDTIKPPLKYGTHVSYQTIQYTAPAASQMGSESHEKTVKLYAYASGVVRSIDLTVFREPPQLVHSTFSGGVVTLTFNVPMDTSDYSFSWEANSLIESRAFNNFKWSADGLAFSFSANLPAETSITFVLNNSFYENPDGFKSADGLPLARNTRTATFRNW